MLAEVGRARRGARILALAAGGAQAEPLELLYAFGSYSEAKVAVDHAGNIVVAAPGSGTRGALDVCDVADPTAVRCEPFGSTVFAGPPGTFERPGDIDFDGAGKMVVANSFNNRIQICDASDLLNGPVVCEAIGGFDLPTAVAVLDIDRVAVAERNRVRLCDLSDRPVVRCERLDLQFDGGGFAGLAADGPERLFVADGNQSRLSICNITDWQATSCARFGSGGSNPGQFEFPTDVTLDGNGNLLVADTDNSRIQECDLSLLPAVSCEVLVTTPTPHGVASDLDGNIVVARDPGGPIRVFGAVGGDGDGDGVLDADDNCPAVANPNQTNTDGDAEGDACDADDDNDSVADANDNCPLDANADQADGDGDGVGDACDGDLDGDGVLDVADACLPTAGGEVVDATGCSIADLCPCDGGWKNHGEYVSCASKAAGDFAKAGLIGGSEKGAITSEAARSSCGKDNDKKK